MSGYEKSPYGLEPDWPELLLAGGATLLLVILIISVIAWLL